MAALTFGELWRQFHLEHASIDPLLCRQWVLDAYKRACTDRRWGFLRAEGVLTTLASRSVTVGVTNGNAGVTSAAAFVASDAGRQFRVGGVGIPYTIASYDGVSNLTLDRVYSGTTNALETAMIFDGYVTLPEDFDSFRSLINPSTQRPMPWMLSRETLDYWDPHRQSSDSSARMLVSHRMSAQEGLTGRFLYEWWPYPTAAHTYPYTYYRRPDTLADTQLFVGVLSTRAEDLLAYARYRAALYPGTTENRNPGFSPTVAGMHKDEWAHVLQTLAVVDDDHFLQSLEMVDWRWVQAGLPFDSAQLRASDASGYDAWSGGYPY